MKSYLNNIALKEPAVLLGAFFSLVAYIAKEVSDNPSATTWEALVPLVVGAIVRFFVYSPASTNELTAQAFADGQKSVTVTEKPKRARKPKATEAKSKRKTVQKSSSK